MLFIILDTHQRNTIILTMNKNKIILHLCADTGSDTMPYKLAGYDVRLVGSNIGVEGYHPPENVYGIIANPPCTMFSLARSKAKTPRDLKEGMRLVKECLRIIWECQYPIKENQRYSNLKFWAIENPATGFLKWFLGNPTMTYSQFEWGANANKKTALWGMFNVPVKPLLCNPIIPGSCGGNDKRWAWKSMEQRSQCCKQFAEAFFRANQ